MLRLHNLVTSWISPVDPDEPRKAVGGQSWTSRWSVQPILVALRKACLSGGYGVGGGHRCFPATTPPRLGQPFLSGGFWLLVCPLDSCQTNWKASEGRGLQTRMPSVQCRPPNVYRTTLCARLCAEDTGPQKILVLALGGEGRIQKVSIQRQKCYSGRDCWSLSLEDGCFSLSDEVKRGW